MKYNQLFLISSDTFNPKIKVVSIRAQMKYKQLIDRFFMENVNVIEPEKRDICLHDFDYFFKLLESTIEYYDLN